MEELRAQLVVKGREEVDAAVQTIPPTTETTPTETTPTAVILQTRSVCCIVCAVSIHCQ